MAAMAIECGRQNSLVNTVKIQETVEEISCQKLATSSAIGEIKVDVGLDLPSGYRFTPYGNRLLFYYLLPKILGRKLPCNFIPEVIDLYQYDRQQLPIDEYKHCKPNKAYFFTNTESKYLNEGFSKRTTNSGYWKNIGGDRIVFHKKQIVGYKKTMVFYRGKASAPENWIMDEYRFNPYLIPKAAQNASLMSKIDSYVVCRIRCKTENNEKTS